MNSKKIGSFLLELRKTSNFTQKDISKHCIYQHKLCLNGKEANQFLTLNN